MKRTGRRRAFALLVFVSLALLLSLCSEKTYVRIYSNICMDGVLYEDKQLGLMDIRVDKEGKPITCQ